MNKTTITTKPGILYGISNPIEQPGKMFKAWDGTTLLLILPLDKAFPSYIDEDGMFHSGVEANLVFYTLQTETDGTDLTVDWQ